MQFRKVTRILCGVLIVYALLVATHLGEFWPFSIYPMFSQAGNEWSKSLVHEIDPDHGLPVWEIFSKNDLPGESFALNRIGLNQNDLADLLANNEDWSEGRMEMIRRFFGDQLERKGFVVFLARGWLEDREGRELRIGYTPYFYLYPDSTVLNPQLVDR